MKGKHALLAGAVFLAFGGLLVQAQTVQSGADSVIREDWLSVYIMGRKAGWVRSTVSSAVADGRRTFETRTTQNLTIKRGATTLNIVQESRVVEDENGNLISFNVAIEEPRSKRYIIGKIVNGDLLSYSGSSPEPVFQKRAITEQGRCPYWLDKRARESGYQPGQQMEFFAWMPEVDHTRPLRAQVAYKGDAEVEILGGKRRLHRAEMTSEGFKGITMVSWYDDDGVMWRNDTGGFLGLKLLRTNETLAKSMDEPAELMVSTYVPADRLLSDPRRVCKAQYRIRAKDGAKLPDFPEGVGQTVAKGGDGEVIIEIALSRPAASIPFPCKLPAGELKEYLAASPLLEIDDPAVVQAAAQATVGAKDCMDAARAIEAWVRATVKTKGLDVGFASALETLKQSEGDCTEHGVLCAALARALGIPSRVVAGLVYLRPDDCKSGNFPCGAFVYHLWTEVYIGQWVAIDAAVIPPEGFPVDATHIAFARSELHGPMPMELCSPILAVGGAMEIEIIEAE
ncbi:MAG TPA: transglutaminase-like domain-containing protein [Candidatus Brocadiia bacterium]|nr:transglutaminase-like domain-containing protein [Candidatus Brocadiia bacterium]